MRCRFVETAEFQKLCKRNKVKDHHIHAFQNELLDDPKKGDLIVGSGGARKLRVASDQKGKSGSFRVIYTDFASFGVIYLWVVIVKSEADNISPEEKKFIKKMNTAIKNALAKGAKKNEKI